MKKFISDFLSEADKEKIINAVTQAEKETMGEIVPIVSPSSSGYSLEVWRGAFILSIALSLSTCFIAGVYHIKFFLPLFVISMTALYFLIDNISFIKRLFVPSEVMDREISQGAMAAFCESGLFRTKYESGILIYISIFERRVYILADRGINERVNHEVWEESVGAITSGIRQGRQCQAIVEAVERMGNILKEHFPAGLDNGNELPNLIIKE